jgi:MarR family transcriptional regulator for hemolysin
MIGTWSTECVDEEIGSVVASEDERRRAIVLRLTVLARLLRNRFDRKVASLRVTRSQWALIAFVSRQPGATQRVIAEALDMSEASVGRLIDRLCVDGLLERRERNEDRRVRAIHLTETAESAFEKITLIVQDLEERVFSGFREDELDYLKEYLERIYANILAD